MRDYDAFGAVDDEGAVLSHLGHVAEEDRLLFDLVGLVDLQLDRDVKRHAVGDFAFAALFFGKLRFADLVLGQTHFVLGIVRRVVGDRRNLFEELVESVAEQPIERIFLDLD